MSKIQIPNKFPNITDYQLKYNGTTLWITHEVSTGTIQQQVLKQRGIAPEIEKVDEKYIHIELNEIT